ncbi:hypothetical protein LXA47_28035 [Massilia sp. P8910]|uniref:hypothetical protein n=1 Tax=Massilia antarctica TaxID=2765360 RepID=UPI001E2CA2D4|nr:hypothetical protein [Massilia antarctica]MCE3607422.1 hypothetical protein [Massilia antarctica]
MQVIDKFEILEMIGGSGAKNIKCTVSTSGVSCEGSLQDYYEAAGEAAGKLQKFGGRLGCWLYDMVHD